MAHVAGPGLLVIACTVAVLAYNEEQNVVRALRAICDQRLTDCVIDEIVVVASGCTDRTAVLAEDFARDHPQVRVVREPERCGKATAVNTAMALSRTGVLVMVGADTLPDPDAVAHLVRPFRDPSVGMTGGRVVPLDDPRTRVGFTVQMLWRVHHRLALHWPKLGELVAFRTEGIRLPSDVSTDEVMLEALLSRRGYRLVYVPDALVYNWGPQSIADFMVQRRRIFAGHLQIARRYGHVAASVPLSHLVTLLWEAGWAHAAFLPAIAFAAGLEIVARGLGTFDYLAGRRHHVWQPVLRPIEAVPAVVALLMITCGRGDVKPDRVARYLREQDGAAETAVWWSSTDGRILLTVPEGTPADAAARASEVASHFAARTGAVSYRLVCFSTAIASSAEW